MKSHSLAWAGCAASQEILNLLIDTGDILIPESIQFGYQDIHFHPLTPEWDIFHESTVLNLSHVVKCSLKSFTPDLLKSWAWISPSLYSTKKILNIYYEKKYIKQVYQIIPLPHSMTWKRSVAFSNEEENSTQCYFPHIHSCLPPICTFIKFLHYCLKIFKRLLVKN